MTLRNRQVAAQAALVRTLGRRLHFELLVLKRLRGREAGGAGDERSPRPAAATISDVLVSAVGRAARNACGEESVDPPEPVSR